MVVKETAHVRSPVSVKSNASDRSGVVIPSATVITVPADAPRPGTSRSERLRIPRSLQLQLAKNVTFGVIGEDSQLYPSSKWVTENRNQYDGQQTERQQRVKPDFVITSLDTRKHNPQTTQIFHIKRINKKPVCSVQASFESGKFAEEVTDPRSVYAASYQGTEGGDSRILKVEHKPAEGIVPVNDRTPQFDVRTEMMLPVCDSTAIPSAHNPHRYLLRKRKVPPPYTSSGVVYQSLEKPRMTSYHPGMPLTGELPFENEVGKTVSPGDIERISVSSLSGQQFSRRKCIAPPRNNIVAEVARPSSPTCVSSLAGKKFTRRRVLYPPCSRIAIGFDGGVPPTSSNNFDDKYLPFIRSRTII